jgi:hypothetical protein
VRNAWLRRRAAFNRRRPWSAVCLLVGLIGLSTADHLGLFGYRGDDYGRFHAAEARVTSVFDDATIEVALPDGVAAATRLRLLGVVGRDDERIAAHALVALTGRRVRLELDPEHPGRDADGALFAYIWLPQAEVSFNERLIATGAARAARQGRYVLRSQLVRAEQAARRARAGRWATSAPPVAAR